MPSNRDTSPELRVKNGKRFSFTIGQIMIGFALFGGGNATCVAVKSCTHDAAPIVGLQTIKAADVLYEENKRDHQVINSELQSQQKAQRHLQYQVEDTDEAVLEVLESQSKRRLSEVKRSREKKWRVRHRKEADIEAALEAVER